MERTLQNSGKSPLRILLMGYVGNNNIGDDLMMEMTIGKIQKAFPDAELTLLIRYQGAKKLPIYPGVKTINLHYLRLGKIKEFLYRSLIVKKFDFVLWVGGTCFGDVGKVAMLNYFLANQSKGIPYGFIGIGIDYCKNPTRRKEVAVLLSKSSLTVFRDEKSLKLGKEILEEYYNAENITPSRASGETSPNKLFKPYDNSAYASLDSLLLSEDIVYHQISSTLNKLDPLWQDPQNKILSEKENRLIISWRYQSQYMDTAKEENSIKELIKYVLEHLEEYDEISILPLDEFLDFEVNRKIYEKLLKETDALLAKKDNKKTVKLSFYPHMEPENKLIYIGRSRVNLCGRLHGMMISLCFASVLVPFSYSLKTKIFLESCHFEQIISSESVTKEKIELAICAQSTNDQPYINPKLLSKKSQEACKNYEYLAERLNSLEH